MWHSPLTNKAPRYNLKESDATSSKSQMTELDGRCMQQRLHRVPGISLTFFLCSITVSDACQPANYTLPIMPSAPLPASFRTVMHHTGLQRVIAVHLSCLSSSMLLHAHELVCRALQGTEAIVQILTRPCYIAFLSCFGSLHTLTLEMIMC